MRPPDEDIFERDCFRCVYCGFDGNSFRTWAFLQVDHFKPKSRGGTDEKSNLVTSCCICNHMKLDEEFSSVAEAREKIGTYWAQMENYWHSNVAYRTVIAEPSTIASTAENTYRIYQTMRIYLDNAVRWIRR
ncbi:HNH endonuclease [Methylocucumis oryzae]|uniref:HNH nuclease domain-containing protein n=1 Tax=Methylocucumis oryzae TaxID=1632867 RepID=A0A0F3ILR0_9GAMM|nr:HNH endonuclease signature motif containing protein [Methylocucumis oryzae]KJV07582.1 hypothetical protein VZ94_03925 [Methylocucumis oryzae]